MFGAILEATVMILILGLILANADNFAKAIQAAGNVYAQAVTTLSGVGTPR
jgi:hypothetical protein